MKGQRTVVTVPLMMVLLLCSCASLSEIRQREPYRTLTSSKAPKELAKCIELNARSEIGTRFNEPVYSVVLEEHPDQTYHVALTAPPTTAIADVHIKPSESGSTVECRTLGAWLFKGHLWEIIERCGK